MTIETVQNFTILTELKSPLETDLTEVPSNRFLRIIVEGKLSEKDAFALDQLASTFEKYSIVLRTGAEQDLRFLKWMNNLNHFSIGSYSTKDLEYFDYLPNDLECLSIGALEASAGTLDYLLRFDKLRKLVIEAEVKDLSVLGKLPSLENLQLYRVKGFQLDTLRELPNLKKLMIRFGDLKDLSPLRNLNQLEHLALWKLRGIANLDWIQGMTALQSLTIGALNQVTNFPRLEQLKKLHYVELEQLKSLESLSNIATAPQLEKLHLVQMNQIPVASFAAFLKHKHLKALTTGLSSKKKRREVTALLKLPIVSFEPFYFMKNFEQ